VYSSGSLSAWTEANRMHICIGGQKRIGIDKLREHILSISVHIHKFMQLNKSIVKQTETNTFSVRFCPQF